jgi:hypothetical protein
MELLKSARAAQQMMAIACDVPVGNGSSAGKLTRQTLLSLQMSGLNECQRSVIKSKRDGVVFVCICVKADWRALI